MNQTALVCGVTDAGPLVIVLTRHCVDYALDHQLDPALFAGGLVCNCC